MPIRRATKLAIAERRQKVAKLYLQGRSQAEIAGELGVGQAAISKDIEKVRIAWRESAIRDFDAQRDMEVARLNEIEKEAWAAWVRSQQPAQTAVVNGSTGAQQARRTVKHQTGDPRYLDLALRCNEERRKILGLDAPTKIAPVTPDGRPLTLEQRRTHILAIIGEQLGPQAVAQFTEVTHEPASNPPAPGEHDRRGTLAVEPARDDEESLSPSAAGRVPEPHV